MIDQRFVFLGVLLNLVGVGGYILSTFKGTTKPNRVSWLLWGIIPLIAFAAELKEDVGLPSVMTLTVGLCPLLVFVSSFVNRSSYWKTSALDVTCGVLAILAIVIWQALGNGDIAIAFSLGADLLAGLPTLHKALLNPDSENGRAFLFGASDASITLLTIKNWTFANYAYPSYILLFCIFMFALVEFRIGKRMPLLITDKAETANLS